MKDLHIHTKYSDGEHNEFGIINEVIKSGVTEFSITDHDTIIGSQKVYNVLKENNHNLTFHTGVELTCRVKDFNNGVNEHILVYDFDYNNPKLIELIEEISKLRFEKIKVMQDYIEEQYQIKIPENLIEEKLKTTNSFGKPHIYSILCSLGEFDRTVFYKKMDKLNTAHLKLDAQKVILNLKDSCKLFLAHPIEIMDEYQWDLITLENFIKHLKDLGIHGIETHHSKQTKEFQEHLSSLAKKYNLLESCGSDFHGEKIKPNLKIGQIVKE